MSISHAEVLKLLGKGLSFGTVAARIPCSRMRICQIAKEHGIKSEHAPEIRAQRLKKALAMIKNGTPLVSVAAQTGFTASYLSTRATAANQGVRAIQRRLWSRKLRPLVAKVRRGWSYRRAADYDPVMMARLMRECSRLGVQSAFGSRRVNTNK